MNWKDTQNYWAYALSPSSGILETRKHDVSETGSVSVIGYGEEDTYSVVSLRKCQRQSLDTMAQQSRCLPPHTWGRKQSQFPKRCFLQHLTMDKVQKPSNSKYYTPSSEPFRIYFERYYPGFCLARLKKITKNTVRISWPNFEPKTSRIRVKSFTVTQT
jgi:hypothetical protein